MNERFKAISAGVIGTGFPSAGIAVSLSQVETWLRIASLVVGLTVGIVTLYRQFKKDKS